MKALVCELCGSNDIVKKDGFFVCQHCGTKYSPEEARKMMIEGPVTVVGTVSIDNSASYDRILGLARDAFTDKRFDSAYDYYCQAVDIRPDEFENVLRQGLSILGKEPIQSAVPSSCVNRVNRALDLLSAVSNSEQKSKMISSALEDLQSACDQAKSYLSEEIRDLDAQKMATRSAGDVLADLGRPTFVASQNQAEDKRIQRHNSAIGDKISAVNSRKKLIDQFQAEYKEKFMDRADIDSQIKKDYLYKEKKQKLESEIRALRSTILQTQNPPKKTGCLFFFVILGLAALGIGLYFTATSGGSVSPVLLGLMFLLGLFCIIFGIIYSKPKKSEKEDYARRNAEAKEQLAKKEADLADLEKSLKR